MRNLIYKELGVTKGKLKVTNGVDTWYVGRPEYFGWKTVDNIDEAEVFYAKEIAGIIASFSEYKFEVIEVLPERDPKIFNTIFERNNLK